MKHQFPFIIMLTAVYGFNTEFPIGDCPECRKFDVRTFEPLKRVAIIKAEILRRVGLSQQPSEIASVPKQTTENIEQKHRKVEKVNGDSNVQADDPRELSEILSYSEIPENFTDVNIIQFKVAGGNGQNVLVKSANLVVRVKYRPKPVKEQRSSSGENRKRKRRKKTINLTILSVDSDGKPGIQLASVKSKLRKTKWLRLNLPQDIVQRAVDSDSKTFQIYVKCEGCDRRTKLILAQKGRRRGNSLAKKEKVTRKLHKRRPILYLHTQVNPEIRNRRSAQVSGCSVHSSTNCSCRKIQFVVDFKEFDWPWIISPKRYKTAVCENVCSNNNQHMRNTVTSYIHDNSVNIGLENRTRNLMLTNNCAPVQLRTLRLLYYDLDGKVQAAALPNMIVRKCGCKP